jgi:hypothetical protein
MGTEAPAATLTGAPGSTLMPGGRLPLGCCAGSTAQRTPVAPVPALARALTVMLAASRAAR